MDKEDRDLSLCEGSPTKVVPIKRDARGKCNAVCVPAGRKRQPVQEQQLEEEPSGLEEASPISPEMASWIKCCAKELKIKKVDLSWAAEVVNDFRENLLKFLKSNNDQPYFQTAEFLNTGSYFEKVKIHSPDEFDMMLILQAPTPVNIITLDNGLFYRLDLNRPVRSPIQAFLLENERTISSSKILNEMHRLVRKFLKTYKAPDKRCHWKVNRKHLYSPAVTLSLCKTDNNSDELISVDVVPALMLHNKQGWPLAIRNGPDVDKWLGKKVRQEIMNFQCVFVPKRLKGRNISEEAKESWRISFSLIEKEIITKHGHTKTCCETYAKKCCRKQCLMLLKSLIEGLKRRFPKELDDLCSYHGKTTFLHMLSIRFNDTFWTPKQLPVCFLHLLGALEGHASSGVLPHFFVPTCNLFSPSVFSRKALAFLVNALEEQKREGLPLLKPPAPVLPLRSPCPLLEAKTKQLSPTTAAHSQSAGFNNKIVLVLAVALGLCVLFLI